MGTYQNKYQRSAAILNHKYCIYMIPALLSAVGVSLSEFADSLIVGRLLNENAFAIVNLGIPIVFMAATIYTTTGLAGPFGCPDALREDFDRYVFWLCWFVIAGVVFTNITSLMPSLIFRISQLLRKLRIMASSFSSISGKDSNSITVIVNSA